MNSYTTIAFQVLKESREALSADQILEIAYRLQLVPDDLFGKTQHKTLHARIAEDILHNRGDSLFARTAPGRFCLRQYLRDKIIGGEEQLEYLAPIRADQLKNFYVLCFERSYLENLAITNDIVTISDWAQERSSYQLLSAIEDDDAVLHVRVVIILTRNADVLVNRTASVFGDPLDGTRSIGLVGFLKQDDPSLFEFGDFGLTNASRRILIEQLYFPASAVDDLQLTQNIMNSNIVFDPKNKDLRSGAAAVMLLECPEGCAADKHLSSLEGVFWSSRIKGLNDLQSFDPWSKLIIGNGTLKRLIA